MAPYSGEAGCDLHHGGQPFGSCTAWISRCVQRHTDQEQLAERTIQLAADVGPRDKGRLGSCGSGWQRAHH